MNEKSRDLLSVLWINSIEAVLLYWLVILILEFQGLNLLNLIAFWRDEEQILRILNPWAEYKATIVYSICFVVLLMDDYSTFRCKKCLLEKIGIIRDWCNRGVYITSFFLLKISLILLWYILIQKQLLLIEHQQVYIKCCL